MVPGSHAGRSPDRAPRWCGAWEGCGTELVFLLCVDCLGVQGMHCGKLAPLCFSFRCCCAMRWCEAGEMYSTVRIFLLCVGCSDVQRYTAAGLFRCASLSAVAAQCALWVRSWKIFCFVEWKKHFSFFSAHNTLAAPQRPARRQQKETRYISAFSPLPFCKTTPLTNGVKRALYRTPPSYCISALRSNSEKRRSVKQVCRSASLVHPNKRPTTKNALRPARILSTAQAQARSAAQRNVISARICTHETLPPHQREARSIEQPA